MGRFDEAITAIADKIRLYYDNSRRKFTIEEMPRMIDSVVGLQKQEGWKEGKREGLAVASKKPYLNTSQLKSFSYYAANSQNGSLDCLDTSACVNFSYMFSGNRTLGLTFLNNYAYDTRKGEDFSYMFSKSILETFPNFNFQSGKNFTGMFEYCSELKSCPDIDLPSGKELKNMFSHCTNLESVGIIKSQNATSLLGMFTGCQKLKSIGGISFSGLTSGNGYSSTFYDCKALESVTIYGTIKIINNLFRLTSCKNLTVDSLMNFINAFEDNTGEQQYTVYIGSVNLSKLSADQVAIATNKNIILA